MRRHDITAVVVEDGVIAGFLVALQGLKALKSLGTTSCHVDLITVPKELVRCGSDGETLLTLGSLVIRELVYTGDELGLEEEERVIRTYADLVRLADRSAASACAAVHLLVDTEVGDLLVLVVGLDQAEVVLLDDGQLTLAEKSEIVEAGQVLDHVDLRALSAPRLVIIDVHLILDLPAARVFHERANHALLLGETEYDDLVICIDRRAFLLVLEGPLPLVDFALRFLGVLLGACVNHNN